MLILTLVVIKNILYISKLFIVLEYGIVLSHRYFVLIEVCVSGRVWAEFDLPKDRCSRLIGQESRYHPE